MRSVFLIAVFFSAMAAGCDREEEQFSGLSDLVAERNEARRIISKETAQKKKGLNLKSDEPKGAVRKKASEEQLSTEVLYEKDINIVDSSSGTSIAKGVAYMNKNGRIVKIKIQNN